MTPDRSAGAARLLARGAGLLLVLGTVSATLAGCAGGDEPVAGSAAPLVSATQPASTLAATTTLAPTTATPTTVTPTAVALPDGLTTLTQAFDLLAPGYHFASVGSVGGQVVATAEGDYIAGSTRMTTTSQGQTADWIILPEGTWLAVGGVWQESETPAPTSDPISVLRQPQAVTVLAHSPESTTLIAPYPPAVLSLPGEQPIEVTFVLVGVNLQTISYVDPTSGATVQSTISGVLDPTPITTPSLGE